MTQDERWLAKYNEIMTFMAENHRRPSKYNPESPDYDPTLVRPKRRNYRMLHITTDDLPTGWDADNGKVGFKCTATFTSGSEQAEIINRISIV